MRIPPVFSLCLILFVAVDVAQAQQRRPAPRPLPGAANETPAAPGPNVVLRMRMFEVLPDKWPEVARQFGMKPTQRLRTAAYTKQMAAAIQGLQKQQMIHLMSEPEIATVSGYPASLSIGGDEPAEDEPIPESEAVRTALDTQDTEAGAGYTLEFLPKASSGGRIRLELTYVEGDSLPSPDANGRRPAGRGGVRTALDMRNGQTVALVMAGPGGRGARDASPKIMLITPEVQSAAGATAARRPTRTR
jgi:hypothetical protein